MTAGFTYYAHRPAEITAEYIDGEYQRLIDRIAEADASENPDAWRALYRDWNALRAMVGGEGSRRSHAFARNMNDAEREEADRYYRQQVSPVAQKGESVLVNALLASRHAAAVGEAFGPHLLRIYEAAVEPLSPINSELRVAAGNLSTEYMKIIARGMVTVRGKEMTLAAAGSLMTSEEPELRREAFFATRGWFKENRQRLAELFDGLVKLRHRMAQNLGHENYIRLGYLGMGRVDYGPSEVERFRENVLRYATPLMERLRKEQAARLGHESLRPWDGGYDPDVTLPSGVAPVETQLDTAFEVFSEISPDLAAHFDRMRNSDLIDLENRPGKRAGAYCTTFSDQQLVAILCNSTGDQEDVRTLMHEMGHAFQKWESQGIEDIGLQRPTADLAEVHSMGMEYLSLRHMGKFFDEEHLGKFRRGRWKKAVALLCYVCVVDEFQHWVYANPEATPDERDEAWTRIWSNYERGVDYSGYEEYIPLRWYAQAHIFGMPFYYIDYALAETGAMQLALTDEQDPNKAVDDYLILCRIGGTDSLLNVFGKTGLRDPFDPDTMRDLMQYADEQVGAES